MSDNKTPTPSQLAEASDHLGAIKTLEVAYLSGDWDDSHAIRPDNPLPLDKAQLQKAVDSAVASINPADVAKYMAVETNLELARRQSEHAVLENLRKKGVDEYSPKGTKLVHAATAPLERLENQGADLMRSEFAQAFEKEDSLGTVLAPAPQGVQRARTDGLHLKEPLLPPGEPAEFALEVLSSGIRSALYETEKRLELQARDEGVARLKEEFAKSIPAGLEDTVLPLGSGSAPQTRGKVDKVKAPPRN